MSTYSPRILLTHDPMGRLAQGVINGTTTQFLYDGDNLVAEYDGANTVLRRYVHGPGVDNPLVWFEGSAVAASNAGYLIADRQGSIAATANASGAVTATYTYDPYGVPGAWGGSRFRYTGQIELPEAQLYHYKARAYDPNFGHFLQTDPVGYKDDVNLYAYVANDPVDHLDPTGMDCGTTGTAVDCTSFPGPASSNNGTLGDEKKNQVKQSPSQQTGSFQIAANELTPGIGHNGGPPLGDNEIPPIVDIAASGAAIAVGAIITPTPAGDPNEDYTSRRIGLMRDALAGRVTGQQTYPGGAMLAAEANALGRSIVGRDAQLSSGGKGLKSADGLRYYRFPTDKSYGGKYANVEIRHQPAGAYHVNVHIPIR